MLKAIVILVQAIIVIVGAIYAYFLVSAQLTCSMIPSVGTPCSGEKTVIWGVLLLSAPVGIPAMLLSIIIFVAVRRKTPGLPH
jgi:hypothetical protein